MDRPHIEYPCWWDYTLIGPDEENLRLAIGELARGREHRVAFSKLSAQKRYASLHVDIWVTAEEDRNRLFQAFQAHPAVKIVI